MFKILPRYIDKKWIGYMSEMLSYKYANKIFDRNEVDANIQYAHTKYTNIHISSKIVPYNMEEF